MMGTSSADPNNQHHRDDHGQGDSGAFRGAEGLSGALGGIQRRSEAGAKSKAQAREGTTGNPML